MFVYELNGCGFQCNFSHFENSVAFFNKASSLANGFNKFLVLVFARNYMSWRVLFSLIKGSFTSYRDPLYFKLF